MVAGVVLWRWLEKRAGVLRELFTFKGFSFFLFFSIMCLPCVLITVKKRACKEGDACSAVPCRYTLDLGSQKAVIQSSQHLVPHAF